MTVISEFSAVRAAHIILASASPRRVEILNTILGLEARVVPSTFPEDLDKSQFTPTATCRKTRGKRRWRCGAG